MSSRPSYPLVLIPSPLHSALKAQPDLPVFGEPVPRTEQFPADMKPVKHLVSTVYGLLGFKNQAQELLAPEREAARRRFEQALHQYHDKKFAFAEAQRAKLTPQALQSFRQRNIRSLLESSREDQPGESFARAGIAEGHLFERLMIHFPTSIRRRRMLGAGQERYHPDFVYLDPTHRLRIDIELDEPYTRGSKLPIHFIEDEGGKSSDDQRDQTFLKHGWLVVRFSEQQSIQDPDGCARVIAELVERLIGQRNSSLVSVPPVAPHPRWTRSEANLMASQNARDELTSQVEHQDKPAIKPHTVFTPSVNQQRIFDFLEHEQGHGLVVAVAGSGKSTTLLEAVKVIKGFHPNARMVMLAFNRSIRDELESKLNEAGIYNVETATLNGFGLRVIKRHNSQFKIAKYKSMAMLNRALRAFPEMPATKEDKQKASKLYELFQSYIHLEPTNPVHFQTLSQQYSLSGLEHWQPVIAQALALNLAMYPSRHILSLEDQNYLPVKLNLPIQPYDLGQPH